MTVRCAKCGEELLGAVNRCWKCGQQFIARPTIKGLPPVRPEFEAAGAEAAIEATVLEDEPAGEESKAESVAVAAPVVAAVVPLPPPMNPLVATRQPSLVRPVKKAPNIAALGGTVGALVLGVFAAVLGLFRYEAAIVALIGLMMGIWGLYSPRRGWALVGMLLCCLGIAVGTFTGARALYFYVNQNAPIVVEEVMEEGL